MGTPESGAGLYRIEVTSGPGSGVKILNQPPAAAFRESVKVGEQNLYPARRNWLVTAIRASTSSRFRCGPWTRTRRGAAGLPVLVALCGSLLGKNTRGGTIIVGTLNLGGSIEIIPNAVRIAELAIDKQAQTLLMPVSARRQLNDLPDDLWTRISIEFYKDAPDAVFKALME